MDDIIFGGGTKPAVRRQPKEELANSKPSSPAKTVQPVQPVSPRNQTNHSNQPRIPPIVQPSTPRSQVYTKVDQQSESRPKVEAKSQ
jgi:hypothetical protein